MPLSNNNSLSTDKISLWLLVLAAVHLLTGLFLLIGGGILSIKGGSLYYILAGGGMLVSGCLIARRSLKGLWMYAAVFILTVIWGFAEAGLDYWQWVPRIGVPLVIAILTSLAAPLLVSGSETKSRCRRRAYGIAFVLCCIFGGGAALSFVPHGVIEPTVDSADAAIGNGKSAESPTKSQWAFYGGDAAGIRYSPLSQINKDNVTDLKVAWTAHTGEIASAGLEDQNTPLQIGDTLYVCTPKSNVIALDADTGREKWRYESNSDTGIWQRCRSLGFYEVPAPKSDTVNMAPAATLCSRRIYVATNDARLISLDANSGKPCADFGQNGAVDLTLGLGKKPVPGIYSQTSGPLVAGDLIVLGGRVYDNVETNEPSGVIRAFSAITGELVWAWDLGNPEITRLPPEGKSYTPGTPNVWITPTYDAKLGLIYLPLGNTTPDFWGAERTPEEDAHSSSIVALDVKTGRERWKFQTTHHDLWDYDVPASPVLYDIPDGHGSTTPALVQVTKRGQIFLLDRRTGNPIADVQEKPVPQSGAAAGERLSPTQPFSVGMPSIGDEKLTESHMWGVSIFDQLVCRIRFRDVRYEGPFTPPGTDKALEWPGFYGGMNWGVPLLSCQACL
jgi:quinate dehydrogenase (quinone)